MTQRAGGLRREPGGHASEAGRRRIAPAPAPAAALRGATSPTAEPSARKLLQLQKTVGNQSVARLVRTGRVDGVDRKSGPDAAPAGPDATPTSAPPIASPAIPAGSPAPATPPAAAAAPGPATAAHDGFASDATPAAAGAAAPGAVASASSGGMPAASSPAGLEFLDAISAARPSTFAAAVSAAAGAGPGALETLDKSDALPAATAPTGLAPGAAVSPDAAPQVAAPAVDAPPSVGSDAGGAVLEPRGDTDPARADQWARAGGTALDALPTVAAPAPVATRLHAPAPGSALPASPVSTPPALGPAAAAPAAEGDALALIDLHMGRTLPAEAGAALAPARSAGREHAAEAAAVKADAHGGLAGIDSDTRRSQLEAGSGADREIQAQHAGWIAQRASVVTGHKAAIQEESNRGRGEAQQTIADANARAKTKADEAEKSQADGEQRSTGWWDKIKSAGRAVVGAVKDVASAVVSLVAGILDDARRKVRDLIDRIGRAVRQRIDAAVKAIADAARRAWSAMAAALARAQAFVKQLVAAAAALAAKLWAGLKARLAAAWKLLTSAIRAALDAARALVKKIGAALATLAQILKILKSGALQKLFDAVGDKAKLARPIVDKAAPLVDQVPPKADQLTRDKGSEVPPPAATGGTLGNMVVQRTPAPEKSTGDQAAELFLEGGIKQPDPEVPPPAPGEGFWGGVWRHLKATGNHFLQNWQTTLINLVWSLLSFYPVLMQEGPKLWEECKGVIFGGGGVDRFDHVLGVLRRLVNIVAGLVATTGIWALIIGAFSGPGEVFVVGAYETISLAVIGADVALGLVEMGKAWYSATRDGIAFKTREAYLSMFSGSVISTAITIILVVLGAIASRLAKAFKARRLAAAAESEGGKPKTEKPGEAKGAQPDIVPDEPKLATGAKIGEAPTPETIRVGTVRGELHPDFPKLKAEVEKFGFSLEASDGANVSILEVIDENGKLLRTEKKLNFVPGMRYLDFEHELGHIRQMMERFDGKPPPTDRRVQLADGSTRKAQGDELAGILTTKQDTVVEFHNRLQEYIRLKERGADASLLREHEKGVQKYYLDSRSAGLISEKSSLSQFAREHFPDLDELISKYQQAGGRLKDSP